MFYSLRPELDERQGSVALSLAADASEPADEQAVRHVAPLGGVGVGQALGLLAVEEGFVLSAGATELLPSRDRPDPAGAVQAGSRDGYVFRVVSRGGDPPRTELRMRFESDSRSRGGNLVHATPGLRVAHLWRASHALIEHARSRRRACANRTHRFASVHSCHLPEPSRPHTESGRSWGIRDSVEPGQPRSGTPWREHGVGHRFRRPLHRLRACVRSDSPCPT